MENQIKGSMRYKRATNHYRRNWRTTLLADAAPTTGLPLTRLTGDSFIIPRLPLNWLLSLYFLTRPLGRGSG